MAQRFIKLAMSEYSCIYEHVIIPSFLNLSCPLSNLQAAPEKLGIKKERSFLPLLHKISFVGRIRSPLHSSNSGQVDPHTASMHPLYFVQIVHARYPLMQIAAWAEARVDASQLLLRNP